MTAVDSQSPGGQRVRIRPNQWSIIDSGPVLSPDLAGLALVEHALAQGARTYGGQMSAASQSGS
jgi:hypothetical protein